MLFVHCSAGFPSFFLFQGNLLGRAKKSISDSLYFFFVGNKAKFIGHYTFVFCVFFGGGFKKTIYLLMREQRERKRQKHSQREKQVPCMELDVGPILGLQDHTLG